MPNIYILTRSEDQYEEYHETHIIASYNIEDIESLRDKAYQELKQAFELEYPEFYEQEAYDDFDIKFQKFLTVDKNLSRDSWSKYTDYDYSITTVTMIEHDD